MARVPGGLRGTYLTAEMLKTPIVATVREVSVQTIGVGADKKDKVLIDWTDTYLPQLPLNKVNLEACCAAWGDEMNDWIGKKVKLFVDQNVTFQGRKVPGIRMQFGQGSAGQQQANQADMF